MFARVLGPFLIIVPLTAALRASEMHELMADFEGNPLWPWMGGAFALLLGLIVVALHPSWSSPPAIIVSAMGWLMVLRGLLLLLFPAAFMSAADAVIGSGMIWRIGYVALALVGLYLTVVGWRPVRQQAPQDSGLGPQTTTSSQ